MEDLLLHHVFSHFPMHYTIFLEISEIHSKNIRKTLPEIHVCHWPTFSHYLKTHPLDDYVEDF